MTKPTFTPGPWASEPPYAVKDDHIVGMAFDGHKANAHLIAAAPELYEALDELINYEGGAEHGLDDEYVVGRAVAALEKARGEHDGA